MASDQIRIVVAGHTGLNKLRCIQERIIPFLLGRDPNWQRANAGGDAQECARISSRSTPRIYLSYPISKPIKAWRDRSDRSLVDQINHFRHFFSKEAVAFDPITINERPIQIALNDYNI
jgi:hypothetical protein